jgi:hypothetical protein
VNRKEQKDITFADPHLQVRRLGQVVQVASALVQPAGEAFDPQVACLN